MAAQRSIHSPPPKRRRIRLLPLPLPLGHDLPARRRTFWAGWGGLITTITMGVLVVALLVGWVLLWVQRPEGPSIALLTLGCVAFTLLLAILATLQTRLQAHWRMRQVEAVFLAGVSHNLRTPISAIRAAAQALQSDQLSDERRGKLLQGIIHETRRLGLRVENALESSRLEIERRAFSQSSIDLSDLLRKACKVARKVAQLQGGEITLSAPRTGYFHGDPNAIRLLVDNVLDNALKYTDSAPRIEIELSEHRGFYLLRVADGGIGFPGGDAGRLFRRLARGDTSRSGTGLGLPLARAIARGHGGDLHIHSDGPGLGAVVEVWLPAPDRGGEHGRDPADRG